MGTYRCYVDGKEVGSVEASGSLDARTKAKEEFGNEAESAWNAGT